MNAWKYIIAFEADFVLKFLSLKKYINMVINRQRNKQQQKINIDEDIPIKDIKNINTHK